MRGHQTQVVGGRRGGILGGNAGGRGGLNRKFNAGTERPPAPLPPPIRPEELEKAARLARALEEAAVPEDVKEERAVQRWAEALLSPRVTEEQMHRARQARHGKAADAAAKHRMPELCAAGFDFVRPFTSAVREGAPCHT